MSWGAHSAGGGDQGFSLSLSEMLVMMGLASLILELRS